MDFKFNSFPASGYFCHLITLANSLNPDQAQQNVRPDLDPNCLTLDGIPERFFLEKLIEKKNPQMTKKHAKLPSMHRINLEVHYHFLPKYLDRGTKQIL